MIYIIITNIFNNWTYSLIYNKDIQIRYTIIKYIKIFKNITNIIIYFNIQVY